MTYNLGENEYIYYQFLLACKSNIFYTQQA